MVSVFCLHQNMYHLSFPVLLCYTAWLISKCWRTSQLEAHEWNPEFFFFSSIEMAEINIHMKNQNYKEPIALIASLLDPV